MSEELLGDGSPILDESDIELKPPSMWDVVLLNDDFTPVDFVVDLVMDIFRITEDEASMLAILVHTAGRGVAGTFTKDIAETKAAQVIQLSQSHGHPLQAVISPNE